MKDLIVFLNGNYFVASLAEAEAEKAVSDLHQNLHDSQPDAVLHFKIGAAEFWFRKDRLDGFYLRDSIPDRGLQQLALQKEAVECLKRTEKPPGDEWKDEA